MSSLGDFNLPPHRSNVEILRRLLSCHERCLQYPLYCLAMNSYTSLGCTVKRSWVSVAGQATFDPHDRSFFPSLPHSGCPFLPTNYKALSLSVTTVFAVLLSPDVRATFVNARFAGGHGLA